MHIIKTFDFECIERIYEKFEFGMFYQISFYKEQ